MNNNTELAKPLTGLASYYPIVVVGTGCGGAVAASRLARTGQRVCVLSCGPTEPPAELPHDCVRPAQRLFEDERFPHQLRAAADTELAAGFTRAERMLGLWPWTGTPAQRYLSDARAHGAEILTHVEVRAILPGHPEAPGRWRIAFQLTGQGRDAFDAPELFLHADEVILAAGVSGSAAILLRSRSCGLSLSPRLGQGDGCVMAEDATRGVVDHESRVFRGDAGADVHPGLHVCDASILPCDLGVDPSLTVCALTERAVAHLARDRAWRIDDTIPFDPVNSDTERLAQPSLHFTERMRGHLIEKLGGQRSAFRFILTLISEDLLAMFLDPDHVAHLVGTVEAPALSAEPLTARGHCTHLHPEPDGTRRMHYRMILHSIEGHVYCLDGIKQIHAPLWSDTTDLAYTLHDGPDPHGSVLGQGHLSLALPDLARQLTTMEVNGVLDPAQRRHYLTRFLHFFGQALLESYLAPANDSEPGSSAA